MKVFKQLHAVPQQPPKAWPTGEFKDRLGALIVAAEKAGMKKGEIAAALETEAEAMRRLAAINVNLNPVPKIRSGNIPHVGGRLAALIRG